MQNNIETKFTRDVAQNIFDLLTPNTASGRSTIEDVNVLKRKTKDEITSDINEVEFSSGASPRSTIDKVDSYNRIPCDRAQDAIIYFVEEILGLGEIDISKAEKKKKSVWKDPSNPIDEETYAKHYLLYSDSDGVKYRLSISHTFLKVEVRTKRPNLTKTEKTNKASYQMHWQLIRVKKREDGSIALVKYPIKKITINNATRKAIAIGNDTDEKEWNAAYPIGKKNLVDLAIDLRTECALALFDNKHLHESLRDAHITKYFSMLNKLIEQDTKVEVFEVLKSNKKNQDDSNVKVEIIPPSIDIGNTDFIERFELIQGSLDFYKEVPNPAFKLDVFYEQFVLDILIDYSKEDDINQITSHDIEKTRDILENALDMNFPSGSTVFNKAYRSVFVFPSTSIYLQANFLHRTSISPTKKRKKVMLVEETSSSKTYAPGEKQVTSMDREFFCFKLANLMKNFTTYIFSTTKFEKDLAYDENTIKTLLNYRSHEEDKLHILGGMYFVFGLDSHPRHIYLHIFITHMFHTFDSNEINYEELVRQANIFNDFITFWAKLYMSGKIEGVDDLGSIIIVDLDELNTNFDNLDLIKIIFEDILNFEYVDNDSSKRYQKTLN